MDKTQIIEALKSMTILEINELVKALEEEFGVSAVAVAAPAAGGAAGGYSPFSGRAGPGRRYPVPGRCT